MIAYPKTLVRRTVGKTRYRLGLQDKRLFLDVLPPDEIATEQIDRFNLTWSQALTSPFYQKMALRHQLPAAIGDLDELKRWPVLTKQDLRRDEDLVWAGMDSNSAYSTSGTTSAPLRLPRGTEDFAPRYAAMWSYRAAAGLSPFDSFASVGALHVGSMEGRVGMAAKILDRRLKDVLGNSWKINAMHRNEAHLDRELRRIARNRPQYVIGYSTAVEALARRATATGVLRAVGYAPQYAILSSEHITPDCAEAVAAGFDTTVLSEYGSMETGVIAASMSTDLWPMRTLWHSCILRTDADGAAGDALVTTISKRAFPLINYQLGDVIEPTSVGPGGTVLEIGPVQGRAVDILTLPDRDGVLQDYPAMSVVDTVIVEPDVRGLQTIQHDGAATILATAPHIDRTDYYRRAATSIQASYPDLRPGTIRLAVLDEMVLTPRGKQQLMVPEGKVDLNRLEVVALN